MYLKKNSQKRGRKCRVQVQNRVEINLAENIQNRPTHQQCHNVSNFSIEFIFIMHFEVGSIEQKRDVINLFGVESIVEVQNGHLG